MPNASFNDQEIRQAFAEHDRQVTVNNFKVACVIGMVLMPAGIILDKYVYPDKLSLFLELRLACSALIAIFLGILLAGFGHRNYRLLGVTLFMLPASFMAWMIYATEGAASPYYAGLNLVLVVLAFVLHWTFWESLTAASLVIILYVAACTAHVHWVAPAAHGPTSAAIIGELANNLYFLVLTGIIVVTGSYFHSLSRFREFALRYELDKNRAALEESNRKLVELDQIKSRFFANISHELRTPLTLLLAPLESLLQRFHRAFDDDTRNLLATMHANGMRLLKLINDLLDLVRLESGRMEIKPEPLAVDEFARGLASAARQVADDKRIKLETDVAPGLGTVMADRDKLEKILLNLLFNALKFTPAGGRVSLRAEQQGEELVLIVSDTGMGIAQKNLPFIFDRFWQADGSSKRKYQGVGIGLALVKELVEIQHGKVTVESQEGSGTTFTVRLPYQKGELQAKAALPEPGSPAGLTPATGATVTSEEWLANLYRRAELFPALTPLQQAVKPVEFTGNGRRATLLVADDEPDMLRFLKSQLAPIYEVIEAVDGQQAVEKASQFLPDIILLDMMMPEKDGLQACREIRGNVPTQNIPVILLTARADEETKLAALEVGASDFLAKPFSTTELHVRIKNLVESHGYQRSLSKQNVALESTIEQLKDTESQLVQTEKLASLGRMSAGIIHEINNPLNFATTGLYALRAKGKLLPPDQRGEYEEILADVETGIQRVQRIVSDLRTFTHPDVEQCDQVDVAEVVGASLRFLSGEWRDKVRIEEKLAAGQTIWANRNKLVHVLVNLLQNSLDALEHKAFAGEVATIWVEGRLEADRSIIVIRDNGAGIDTEHLGKIFDPFFTTKDVGKGMGLGLSICYRIVREYDGRISVKTERGRFCEFTLDFPGPPPPTTSKETKHGELVRL
ncbi:MAG: ATP-binding protein [Verrucomicrobiota bacterium]|jgi:signal transduction histidine kinase